MKKNCAKFLSLKSCVSLAALLFFAGCVTLPATFKDDGKFMTHESTGVTLPKKMKGWSLKEGATDKVDDEIAGTAFYQQNSFKTGRTGKYVPVATIYLLKNESANGSELIKEIKLKNIKDLTLDRTEEISTSQGKTTARVYRYMEVFQPLEMIGVPAEKTNLEAWEIQIPSKKQTVLWITIDKSQKDSKNAPADFVNNFEQAF